MAGDSETVERFVADVSRYVENLQRAAREADQFGDQNEQARESVTRMGHAAEEAAQRAARAQAEAAREAERLAEGEGDAERAAQAAARAQRELERAQIAQSRAARAAAQAADNEADQYRQLAREAAASGIAQQLAMLRASGRIEEHNQLVRRMREEYGGLGRDSDRAFRLIESRAKQTFDGFKSTGLDDINKIQAGIVALPLVAGVAAGAVTLALGGALSGIAILAAAKNKEVQASYSQLKDHVVSELEQWARPFEGTLTHISKYAGEVFDDFGPELKSAFNDMAPEVDKFVRLLLDGVREFRPLVSDISEGFGAVLDDLGPRMDDILGNLAESLDSIVKAAEQNPEALGNFLEDLSVIAKAAGDLIPLLSSTGSSLHAVASAYDWASDHIHGFGGAIKEAAGFLTAFLAGPVGWVVYGVKKVKDAFDQTKGSTLDASGAVKAAENAYNAVYNATNQANTAQTTSGQLMELASKSAKDLKASLDQLSGKELSAREAAAQYGTAVLALNKTLKENGSAHGFATQKGIQNEQALDSLAQAAQQNAVAMRDNGASANDVAKFMAKARTQIIQAAEKMGYSRGEAVKLADKLIGVKNAVKSIPNQHNTKVTADTAQAQAQVNWLISWIQAKTASIIIHTIGGRAEGGPVGFAAGGAVQQPGKVRGPGTGTSDSILTRLSNGEYVMTAAATKQFEPLLAAMNAAASPNVGAGHDIQRYTSRHGGVGAVEDGSYETVKPKTYSQLPRAAAPARITYVTHNVYEIQGSVWAERELLDVTQRQAGKRNVRNPKLQQFGSR